MTSPTDDVILSLAARWLAGPWRARPGAFEQLVRDETGLSATVFWLRVQRACRVPANAAAHGATMRRVQDVTEARRRRRAA